MNLSHIVLEKREGCLYCVYQKTERKKLLLRKLVRNKYANTLTVASAHKNSRYEKHTLNAIVDICGSSPAVLAAAEYFAQKRNTRQENRKNLLRKVTA